jgi:hypothetical protein
MDGERENLNVANAPQNQTNRRNISIENRQEMLEIARGITQLFNLERYVYIACCGFAVVLLLINAVMIMWQEGTIKVADLGLLFGASGLITYSIGRLIYMWNKLVDLIFSEVAERGEN